MVKAENMDEYVRKYRLRQRLEEIYLEKAQPRKLRTKRLIGQTDPVGAEAMHDEIVKEAREDGLLPEVEVIEEQVERIYSLPVERRVAEFIQFRKSVLGRK